MPLIRHDENGSGETIAIIDWTEDPTIAGDLAEFDSRFKLPAPPSFEVIAPYSVAPFEASNPEDVEGTFEISIDVELAHAIAPGAKIALVLAHSSENADVVAAERYVVEHHTGDVVSMSYTETEGCEATSLQEEEANIFKAGVEDGITFLAGSGDEGVAAPNCEFTAPLPEPATNVPAADPNVTAVGGTQLNAKFGSGRYVSESVWNETAPTSEWPEHLASGGGYSKLFSAPEYQAGVPAITTQRGVPDVSDSAAAHDGMVIVWGSSGQSKEEEEMYGNYYISGGTSAAAPQWAGLVAIADQIAGHGLGNINPAFYAIAESSRYHEAFHDITEGNNSYPPLTGYVAESGWDAATGWGSPIADKLIPVLSASHAETVVRPATGASPGTRVTPSKSGARHRFRFALRR